MVSITLLGRLSGPEPMTGCNIPRGPIWDWTEGRFYDDDNPLMQTLMFTSCVRLKIKLCADNINFITSRLADLSGGQFPNPGYRTAYLAGLGDLKTALTGGSIPSPFFSTYGGPLVGDPTVLPIRGWLVAAVNDCLLGSASKEKRVRGTFTSKLGSIKRRIRV